jgi:hypothetical protein
MIHDGACEAIVFNQDQRVSNGRRHRGVGAGLLQCMRDMHGNKEFVFDDEDRASSEAWVLHVRTDARLSAIARGRAVFLWWAAVSRAPINPQRATSVMIDWLKAMPA